MSSIEDEILRKFDELLVSEALVSETVAQELRDALGSTTKLKVETLMSIFAPPFDEDEQ